MGKVSSLDQVKSLIRRWELSGLSKSSFCRDQQMSYCFSGIVAHFAWNMHLNPGPQGYEDFLRK